MKLASIVAAASPEVPMNENFEAIDAASTFGIRRAATAGLTFGYYGGQVGGSAGMANVPNGTIALTGSATNYIEITANAVISKNTSGFTAGSFPLYTVVTSASGITTITDQRCFFGPMFIYNRLRLSNAIATANGTGIVYPATQDPSSDSNVLDDYEEGNWTPNVGGTATYTTQVGRYIKVGKKVSLWGRLVINAIGTGSTTTISGLPFASANNTNLPSAGVVTAFAALAHTVVFLNCQVTVNASTITFNELTAAAAATTPNAAILGAGADVSFFVEYEAAN